MFLIPALKDGVNFGSSITLVNNRNLIFQSSCVEYKDCYLLGMGVFINDEMDFWFSLGNWIIFRFGG
jgi:hypothetical protein